jgi:hypothetical protein
MKKVLTIIGFSLGILFFIYLLLRLIWSFNEKKELNIYILDKTVTRSDRPEHKAFTWLLNNNRYVLPNKKGYSHTKDYYGFFPVNIKDEIFDFKSIRINEVDAYAAVFDVAYYTDCYGVHSFEWYKGKTKPIRSQKVYGGLNQNDYLLIKKMIDNGKLVIAEYNMFSTPTNALVRSKTEALLDISWTSWLGKYFSTLDVGKNGGPPEWMKNLYESQHLGVWPTNKDGIVLLSNDGLIELLIQDIHLNSSLPSIVTQPNEVLRFGVNENVLFEQWFEFINPGQNHVVSYFEMDVNSKGEEVLAKLGLNTVTPAVIMSPNGTYYYLCGNFAENPVQMWTAKIAGGKWINSFLYQFGAKNRANFFSKYYTPLINTILEEHYASLKKN